MNNNKDVVPLIINGEINDGRELRKKKNINNVKLPKKRFTFLDLLLTLLGIVFVGYGIYTMVYDDKKEDKKDSNITSNKKIDTNKYLKYIPSNLIDGYNIYSKEDSSLLLNTISVDKLSNNAIMSFGARVAQSTKVSEEQYIKEEELDKAIKNIFGDIKYNKESFSYGNKTYIYNSETKRYYLESKNDINLSFDRIDYVDLSNNDNELVIRDYVVLVFSDKQTLLDGNIITDITKNNIKDNLNKIKYYEYKFVKEKDNYLLKTISIK